MRSRKSVPLIWPLSGPSRDELACPRRPPPIASGRQAHADDPAFGALVAMPAAIYKPAVAGKSSDQKMGEQVARSGVVQKLRQGPTPVVCVCVCLCSAVREGAPRSMRRRSSPVHPHAGAVRWARSPSRDSKMGTQQRSTRHCERRARQEAPREGARIQRCDARRSREPIICQRSERRNEVTQSPNSKHSHVLLRDDAEGRSGAQVVCVCVCVSGG